MMSFELEEGSIALIRGRDFANGRLFHNGETNACLAGLLECAAQGFLETTKQRVISTSFFVG